MSLTTGLSLCFLCFYVVLSLSMTWGDRILPCMEISNVTIIPHIIFDGYDHFVRKAFLNSSMQLRYLVKSMLDTPCFIVWVFCPLRRRLIRLTEENYIHFWEGDLQIVTETDENELIKVLENMPHNNENNKQTLLLLFDADMGFFLHKQLIKQAKKMYEQQQDKDKLIELIKEEEEKGEMIVIHLPIFQEKKNNQLFRPMTFNDKNTINIIESSTIEQPSPVLQNGEIVIQEDDYFDPLFFKIVFEKISYILCGVN